MSDEYRALVHKVSAFCETQSARYRADMACGPGCSSCCHAWLSVCAVEDAQLTAAIAALPQAAREEIAERGQHQLEREHLGETGPRCALLDDQGRCAVYEHRPLVCRTQGLALRYPHGVVPVSAVRERLSSGDVTCCPLNFSERVPATQDVLDAERVDQLLGLVNVRFSAAVGDDPARRRAISAIAAAACD
ncbi:MAG TPA: YkgJ family cysteine cluster protein [Polyangiales bacterium]|nr:YkgJ family cysteine cluster protein [Polyangiales bacterium]